MSTVTVKLHTLVAFAAGLAIAVVGAFAFASWRVEAAPGDADATFVPIAPCRLIDTRPAPDRVGPFGSFGIEDTKTITAHGSNGDCVIPSDAVGLSTNVTAVGATANTFLTFWAGGDRPTAANLNPRAGGAVTPNAVNTPLSGAGTFAVFNKAGSVDVVVDVNGYYTNTSLQALAAAQPFVVSAEETAVPPTPLTSTTASYQTVTVTAPVTGHVTVHFTAIVQSGADGNDVRCSVAESTDIPGFMTTNSSIVAGWHERAGAPGDIGSASGTRTFEVAAGNTVDYVLVCQGAASDSLHTRALTAIFTPAPAGG